MKSPLTLLSFLLLLSAGLFTQCSDKDNPPVSDNSNNAVVSLTQDEKDLLLHLREEEKLARDVYFYAFRKYGQQIFSNISNSEQTHMDQILGLINKYGLVDPAKEEGTFTNEGLQTLYDQLTAKADLSLNDALIVGATIEDLDIQDIEEFRPFTSKADILAVLDNLQCGSRNHLRSYYSQITSNGGTYTRQFISQNMFDAIINSQHEKCGQ